MTAPNWKNGDRVTLDPALAPSYRQPWGGLIAQGREATLRVDQRDTLSGRVTFYVVTFDRKGGKGQGHRLEVKPQALRRVPS